MLLQIGTPNSALILLFQKLATTLRFGGTR